MSADDCDAEEVGTEEDKPEVKCNPGGTGRNSIQVSVVIESQSSDPKNKDEVKVEGNHIAEPIYQNVHKEDAKKEELNDVRDKTISVTRRLLSQFLNLKVKSMEILI